MVKFVGDIMRDRPFRGHRLINVSVDILEALEGLSFDVSCLATGVGPVLSITQRRLLAGNWPLCRDAAQGAFSRAVCLVQKEAFVDLFELELEIRRDLFTQAAIDAISTFGGQDQWEEKGEEQGEEEGDERDDGWEADGGEDPDEGWDEAG